MQTGTTTDMLRRFVCLTGLWLLALSAFAQTSVNVAAAVNGGVATASSSYASNYGPSGTIDGDRKGLNWGSGGGWNDGTANAFPDWLQVNFNSLQRIGEIDVFTIQDNYTAPVDPTPTMTFTGSGITDFQVQYWNGSGWADVPGGNVTGNDRVWRRFMFATIITDRIRVLVNNGLASYSRLVEIEAWSAVAPPPPVDFQITGTVTAGSAPLPGVMFAATNGGTCTPSDAGGQYNCTVAQSWSGNVTPALNGYSFTPTSRSYANVQATQTGQDFTAAAVGSAARVYYIETDHLNTPRMIANQQGTTVWRWDQGEPFGNDVPNNNPSGAGAFEFNLRFPGQYFDRETNLAYNLMRNYDPGVGRYLESDPIGLRGGVNTFAYVGSSPLRYVDPLGLFSWIDVIPAWNHYCDGTQTSWTTDFGSINWGDARSRINAKIKGLVGSTCTDVTIPVNFEQPAQTEGADRWIVGRHTLRVKGQIKLKCDCSWSFGGDMESATGIDPYNFNPSPGRGIPDDIATWVGRKTNCGGKTFNIYIVGSEGLSLSGKISGTPTCPGC